MGKLLKDLLKDITKDLDLAGKIIFYLLIGLLIFCLSMYIGNLLIYIFLLI